MLSQLSGGQQQRVALARALVIEPARLLLDEPLGALDKSLRANMQVELRALQRRLGITTVMVTHDQDEALTMSDRIVIMREGRIEQIGEPAEVCQHPATRFTASFLGVSNFFRGPVTTRAAGEVAVAVANGPLISACTSCSVGGEVTLALRPEAIDVAPDEGGCEDPTPNSTCAVVEQVIYPGFVTHLHLRLRNGEPLIAFCRHGAELEKVAVHPGMSATASWSGNAAQVVRDEPS